MKVFWIATLSISTLVSLEASSQASWPVVYKSTSVTVALDTAGARRNSDGSYLTRTRWDYVRDHLLESKKPYREMTQTALLRCTPLRVKRLTESFYSSTGAVVREGTMPDRGDIQYMTWDRLIPRTDGSRASTAICSLLTRRDRRR
jgi:surface-adhesin protein E